MDETGPAGTSLCRMLVELAGAASLLETATLRGHLLPARLRIDQRSGERDGQTLRYAVPVLDVDVRGTRVPEAVRQKVIFVNDAASHLGVPLPAGLMRAYVRDAEGALRFIGEDRIGNAPVGNEVALDLGRAFDVTVERQQTAFRQLGDRTTETAFTLKIRNGGLAPATVRVIEG